MTHDPDANITQPFPDVTDVFESLMQDIFLTGKAIHRTNADGSWTRIRPEDYHSQAPSSPNNPTPESER